MHSIVQDAAANAHMFVMMWCTHGLGSLLNITSIGLDKRGSARGYRTQL